MNTILYSVVILLFLYYPIICLFIPHKNQKKNPLSYTIIKSSLDKPTHTSICNSQTFQSHFYHFSLYTDSNA